jgi:hypothetical protein
VNKEGHVFCASLFILSIISYLILTSTQPIRSTVEYILALLGSYRIRKSNYPRHSCFAPYHAHVRRHNQLLEREFVCVTIRSNHKSQSQHASRTIKTLQPHRPSHSCSSTRLPPRRPCSGGSNEYYPSSTFSAF